MKTLIEISISMKKAVDAIKIIQAESDAKRSFMNSELEKTTAELIKKFRT